MFVVTLMMTGCNHNDEPPMETRLRIYQEYLPVSIDGRRSDDAFISTCREWNNKRFMVNSVDGLPDDPIGFSQSYKNISFTNQSLLITYRTHWWEMVGVSNMFVKNNVEKTFNWTIMLDLESMPDEPGEMLTLTRFAILVPKIPSDSKLQVWWSYTDLSFDWPE